MTALTRWTLSHKLIVVGFWIILATAGAASASSAVNALSPQISLPGKESYRANLGILRVYGTDPTNPPFVPVVTLPAGTTMRSPGVRAQLATVFGRIAARMPGSRVVSFASTGNPAFVSRDGRTTFGLVYPAEPPSVNAPGIAQHQIEAALKGATVAGEPVHLTGLSALASGGNGGGGPNILVLTLVGGALALLVLIFVFRSFMALMPLLMAVAAIPTTFLLIWGLTAVTAVSFIVQFLVALIGLGVAIDYSLVVVLRWREERMAGVPNEQAIVKAMETAGRSVIFSGTTVGIGLLALVVLPVPALRSAGYGGALIPLVTVAVAITLLPVLLATVGPRLDWPRASGLDVGRAWTSWARLIVRRPWLGALLGLLVLGALAASATTMVLGETRADALARAGDAHAGLLALERSGIGAGSLSPFEVLVGRADSASVAARLEGVAGVHGVVAPTTWQKAGTAIVEVLPAVDANTSAGHDVLNRVRRVAHRGPGNALVGGQAAYLFDTINAVYGETPWMVILIALITFVLLARAFRSLLLPLKAVLLNMLSLAAALGVMVLIWQDGYGSQAIWGIRSTGAIYSWVPIIVFAFLFGLSMDYEVFILARMREEYDATRSTRAAVIRGIGRTGRLVTSGALILFFAFVALTAGPETDAKVIGTGLGAGILLDATVVRMLLVPSLISLFGRWNWWLPHLPARFLRVQPSGPSEAPRVEAA
ncbi:MAG: MMPL family transporter [Chloroflexi bacterium]|nr:MMPL family transporter [Chloroflexota bacterium]